MENHLLKYDDFLNESIITDAKEKIKAYWQDLDFQTKEQFLRKMILLAFYGSHALLFLSLLIFISMFLGPDVKKQFSFLSYFSIFFNIMLSFIALVFSKSRKKLIQNKMREISNDFVNNNFKNSIYSVIGNRKNIKSFINKIKEDGIISDINMLDYQGITLIDFSGTINNKKTKEIIKNYSDVDPYGEENWEDEQPGFERDEIKVYKSMNRIAISKNLERNYKIRLRKIADFSGLYDTIMRFFPYPFFSKNDYSKKTKRKDMENYNLLIKKRYGKL